MTPTTALAHLGLPELPPSRADLQRQVAARVDPRRWSWDDTAAYRCLWAELGQQRKPAERRDSSRTAEPAAAAASQKRRPGADSEHQARLGVYRPGMTRAAALKRAS
jgi:hypothetical protein